MTDWEKWFEKMARYSPQVHALHSSDLGHFAATTHWEEMYQTFKARLMHECTVAPRMTEEEYEAWKKAMVVK